MSGDGDIRVLHVDDETELAEVAAMHVERIDDNITVVTESSAHDGLERLRTTAIDCVVSDHDMAEMDGLEFLKAVREEFPELPFILFTGKGNEEIASDAISAGVTEYLQKDVGTDQYAVLANRIERAVGEQRAKAALEESERQLSTLISNLPGMVYQCKCEDDWPMQFVSDGADELVGYDAETIESGDVSWRSLIVDDAETLRERMETCVAAGEPFELRYRVKTSDGDIRWMWERGRAVGRTDDGVELLEGFITDITARKERERELEREREFTENLVDTLNDVFYLRDLDGQLIRWNDTITEVTGYSDEELTGVTAFDLVPESFHERIKTAQEDVVEDGQTTIELPLESDDGERRRHEFREVRIEDGRGELVGVAGIGRDITERRARERKLEQYEMLVENVGDAMYILDTDGTVQMANEAMAAHLGLDREEIVGSDPSRFLPPEDIQTVTEGITELLKTSDETWKTFEMTTIDAEGNRTVNETKVAPLLDGGEFLGSAGVIREVTGRKERERELERYETIIEAVGDPVYTLGKDGVFTFINEAIEPMTGYTPEELIGEHIGTILPDEDLDRGDQLIKELLKDPETDSGTFEMDIVTDSGERIPTENNLALLPSPDGTFRGTAGVIRDIGERKEREQRLSEFASVVSHDLRNPLNVVQGRLELARENGDLSHLDEAVEATGRMERLIDDLLTLARQGEIVGTVDRVDLDTAAEVAWATVDADNSELHVESDLTVEADPARLRELLENLFHNAVEHGSTSPDSQARQDAVEHGTTGSDGVTITVGALADGFFVADDGHGVPPEERDDVFERGYSTTNGGTGFGLAIVSDIAVAHGWSVTLTESDSGGARFEFRTSQVDH